MKRISLLLIVLTLLWAPVRAQEPDLEELADLIELGQTIKGLIPYYDKENPKNYVKMAEDIHDILRTIRFREDVKIISVADALSAPLSTKTGPLP